MLFSNNCSQIKAVYKRWDYGVRKNNLERCPFLGAQVQSIENPKTRCEENERLPERE